MLKFREKLEMTLDGRLVELILFYPSVPIVLLNSPNLSPYFSLNKFERILLLIINSLLCLINYHFLIINTKCILLHVLYKEKLGVNNWLGVKGWNAPSPSYNYNVVDIALWTNFN